MRDVRTVGSRNGIIKLGSAKVLEFTLSWACPENVGAMGLWRKCDSNRNVHHATAGATHSRRTVARARKPRMQGAQSD